MAIEIDELRVPAALVRYGYLRPSDEDDLLATRAAIERLLAAMAEGEDP